MAGCQSFRCTNHLPEHDVGVASDDADVGAGIGSLEGFEYRAAMFIFFDQHEEVESRPGRANGRVQREAQPDSRRAKQAA